MQLHNDTPLSARLYRGALHDSVNGAWVVARGCYRRTRRGLVLEGDPWPIFDAPLRTAFGTLPSDVDPMRKGISVFCLGTVRCETPRRTAMCSLEVGEQARQLRVHGRRRWEPHGDTWRPSEAEPFSALPFTWAQCPGGTTVYEGKKVEHPSNPEGMGFVMDEALVPTVEVPHIEDVRAVISDWRALPPPTCWAPLESVRELYIPGVVAAATRDGKLDLAALQKGTAALAHYDAPPDTQFGPLAAGTLIDGQLGDHGVRVRVPGHDLTLSVHVGRDTLRQPLKLSSVWLLIDEGLTVFTWRARTAYPIREGDLRAARLVGMVEGPR